MLNDEIKKELLKLARNTIEGRFQGVSPDLNDFNEPIYYEKRGAFVTLNKKGHLRGCIGYIVAYKSLKETVLEMAIAAAFRDPRFEPVTLNELDSINIEISVLSEMILIKEKSEIHIGRDGLLLEHPYGSGVLLPQVATEYGWNVDTFLEQLCNKAGLPKGSWNSQEAKLYRFSAEVFNENDFNA
ncbi:MAG: AmmeMemoRadiSam system protein A [Candidatus Cloacimonetes bacterium]|nr:AmmeMemoRadiSam system protein A [Candidatus Cloacimonadota bacterium]